MDKTRRAFIIYDLIKRNKVHDRNDMRSVLRDEYGDITTLRSISRALEHLEIDFNIPIEYDFIEEKYKIVGDEMLNGSLADYFKSLDYRLYTLGLHNSPKFENNILYDQRHSENHTKINHALPQVLLAINERIPIQFNYKKYSDDTSFDVILNPYYLKEYHLNWYVEGYQANTTTKRTYGLDRMEEISLLAEKKFTRDDRYPISSQNYVGINGRGLFEPNKIETVRIKLSPFFSQYLANNPLHSSQTEIETDSQGETTFEYKLVINYELVGEILRMDQNCTGLEPEILVNHIKSQLNQIMNKYNC